VIVDAFAGKLPKVHEAILAAGYAMPGKIYGRAGVADLFGVHVQTVVQWEQAGGLPVEKPGKAGKGQGAIYDLKAVVRNRLDKALESASGDADSPGLERWRNARADTAEIERDLLVGSVCKTDWMERNRSALVSAFRSQSESVMAGFCRRWPEQAAEIVRAFEGMMTRINDLLPVKPPAPVVDTSEPPPEAEG
jgi:phage terminase Nu1 subunit (DNA packaging protein)